MAEIELRNLRDSQLAAHYKDSNDNKVYIRTSAKSELSGLRTALKTRCIEVTDVAVLVPAVPLNDRNFVAIHNKSQNIVYMGDANVKADTIINDDTCGWEIDAGEKFNADIKDSIGVWLVCETGKKAIVKTLEFA